MFDMAYFDMAKEIYRIMDEPYALEKRCVPGTEVLAKTLRFVERTRKTMTLSSFSEKDCLMLFKLMYSIKADMSDEDILARRFAVTRDVPDVEEMGVVFQVFSQIIKENECGESVLEQEDLVVLCLIYNMLRVRKDKKQYLERLKNRED